MFCPRFKLKIDNSLFIQIVNKAPHF
jgi:hypothetical protein